MFYYVITAAIVYALFAIWFFFYHEPKRRYAEHFGKGSVNQEVVTLVLKNYAEAIDKAVKESIIVLSTKAKESKSVHEIIWAVASKLGDSFTVGEAYGWQEKFDKARKIAIKKGFTVPGNYREALGEVEVTV